MQQVDWLALSSLSTTASFSCYSKESKHVLTKLYWQTQCAPCVLWPGKLLECPPSKKALSLSLSLHGPCVCYEYISNKHIMKPISPGLWCLNPHEMSFLPFKKPLKHRPSRYKTLTPVASNPWKMISEAIPLSTLGKEEWNATWTFFSTAETTTKLQQEITRKSNPFEDQNTEF